MKTKMEVTFYLRKSRRPDLCHIGHRVTVNGKLAELNSTHLEVRREDWDVEKKKVKDTDPRARAKNERLGMIVTQLDALFNDLLRQKLYKGQAFNAETLKRLYLGRDVKDNQHRFLAVFDAFLVDYKQKSQKVSKHTGRPLIAPSTVETYNDVRKKVVDFLAEKKRLDFLLDEFDESWLVKYRDWMEDRGHADSYIRKHSGLITQLTKWAKLKKYTQFNLLAGFRVSHEKPAPPVYLTDEQFWKLYHHCFKNKTMRQVADVFLVYCRVGMHYQDLCNTIKDVRHALRKDSAGNLWMVKARCKTEIEAKVPGEFLKDIMPIVEHYGGWELLPITSNQKMNSWLKLIAAELDLPPSLSVKAGRKTLTDYMYNEKMMTTEAVKTVLGRKSAKGLEVYGRPDERRVLKELEAQRIGNE